MPGIEAQYGAGIGHGMELVDVGLELGHDGWRVGSEEEKGDACRTIYLVTCFRTPHCSLIGTDPFLTGDSFYWYHQPPVSISGAKSIQLDMMVLDLVPDPFLLISFGLDSYIEFDSLGYTWTIKPCT